MRINPITSQTKFKIRKRVPISLISILNTKEINKTFSSQAEVNHLNRILKEAVEITQSNLPRGMIEELVLTMHNNGLEQYKKLDKSIDSSLYLVDAIALYLTYSKRNTTAKEYKERVQFFTGLLPELFKQLHLPTQVKEIKSSHLYMLSQTIQKLPNRRIYKYRNMPIATYLSLNITADDYMLPDSVNKMIKRIRGFANYGRLTGLYNLVNTIPTVKVPASDGKRIPLSTQDYQTLSKALNHKAMLLFNIIYFSGLRPSEIHKATIDTITGVIAFNLTEPTSALKTKSSYRYVPVHKTLLPYLDEIKALTYPNIRAQSQVIARTIRNVLPDPKGKSLYSARHSVVTNLINNGVPPERVSSIVGHSFSTTTMGVYFQGYKLSQLLEDINTLH